MYRIAFFSIYAHGHTNPTLPVVRELTCRGHQVRYYSFAPFGRRSRPPAPNSSPATPICRRRLRIWSEGWAATSPPWWR